MDGSKKHKILVIEDDAVLMRLVESKLQRRGYEVAKAKDGEAALEQLRTNEFDLVITDLMLPRMDGYQLMRLLNAEFGELPCAFVVLSSRSGEADILQAFELGALDFVTKPFSLDVLLARIEIVLRHKYQPQVAITEAGGE
jgi:DNA-binding response OmpR family regulator